jgi:hypothetical protein
MPQSTRLAGLVIGLCLSSVLSAQADPVTYWHSTKVIRAVPNHPCNRYNLCNLCTQCALRTLRTLRSHLYRLDGIDPTQPGHYDPGNEFPLFGVCAYLPRVWRTD